MTLALVTFSMEPPEELATLKMSLLPAVPMISSLVEGPVVPIPTLPPEPMKRRAVSSVRSSSVPLLPDPTAWVPKDRDEPEVKVRRPRVWSAVAPDVPVVEVIRKEPGPTLMSFQRRLAEPREYVLSVMGVKLPEMLAPESNLVSPSTSRRPVMRRSLEPERKDEVVSLVPNLE